LDLIEQATQLGKVVGNLLSLEFSLRCYLSERELIGPHEAFPYGVSIESIPVGAVVPHNALTSFDPLSRLMRLYNDDVPDGIEDR
jgi:hypothetical protein